ncbi:MAG: T9SS type A sorting domain-containing protein [Prevotellaceae bacterium]|nr:T9SS type A sorting domain-containing protein [Prevotellaceae bacterium]
MKHFTKNITLGAAALLCAVAAANAQAPTVEAPTPLYHADSVKSLISDKYTAVNTLNSTNVSWSQNATYSFVGVGDGSAMQISNLGEKGWLPIALTSIVDLRDMDSVHFDLYCNENTSFRLGFHTSYQYDGKAGEYYGPFVEYTTPGVWVSYSYPASMLTDAGMTMNNILYIRIGSDNAKSPQEGGTPDGIVYSDEIYLNNLFVFRGIPDAVPSEPDPDDPDDPDDPNTPDDPNETTGVKSLTNNHLLKIYPTTVRDNLTLQATEDITEATIHSIAGQRVAKFNVNAASKILNLSALKAGSYIISVKTANGAAAHKKFVKY